MASSGLSPEIRPDHFPALCTSTPLRPHRGGGWVGLFAFTEPMWIAIFSLSGLLSARSTCLRASGGVARCVPTRFTSSLLHLSPCGATAGLTKLLGEYTVCLPGYGRSFQSSLVSVGSELSHPVSFISVYGAPSLMAVVGPWGFLVRCTLARVSLRLSVALGSRLL